MEQLEYPKVYYHGYKNLDDFMDVIRRLDERNLFFKETESELHLTWTSIIKKEDYIIKVVLWKKS